MNTQQTITNIEAMYLDYVNNFLTVDRFAEHYNIDTNLASQIINLGRYINHNK